MRELNQSNMEDFVQELQKTLPREPELRATVRIALEYATKPRSYEANHLRQTILDCLSPSQSSDPKRLLQPASGATGPDEPSTSS